MGRRPDSLDDTVEHRVLATSCPALFRDHGVPDAMKVDLEGSDLSCIRDLVEMSAPRPRSVSVEVPALEEKSALYLMRLLQRWGYRRCKLSRQSIYQSRCWPGRMNCEGAPLFEHQ